eukprot:9120647-Ditylum_brightwellii.AAC.1
MPPLYPHEGPHQRTHWIHDGGTQKHVKTGPGIHTLDSVAANPSLCNRGKTVLAEFKWMADMVAAKQTNITYAEVPDALFPTVQPEKQRDTKREQEEEPTSNPPQQQKPTKTRRVMVNPLLQANIIDGIWRTAPGASLKDIARHSNVRVAQLTKTDNCIHGYINKCSFS